MALTLAEQESAIRSGYDPLLLWRYVTGETDIDDSVQTETTAWELLRIAPVVGSPLLDCVVWIDLAKATTGFAAVESSATITFHVTRSVDGTNYRRAAANEAALSGTNAATRMQVIPVGYVAYEYPVRIYAVMSGDATADMELPYVVGYRGLQAPTITAVAAG